ncbi:MAG: DUF4097 family beta strand repeat protein [Acidobacteria bacterium]|nr:DUF4097 family beta strand repeat protein [Acidobacteriota bacterium]
MTIRNPLSMVSLNKSTFLPALLATMVCCGLVNAQSASRSFTVPAEGSSLEVINQMGTIKVTAGVPGSTRIVISHKKISGEAKVDTSQISDRKVKVEVTGAGKVDFDIIVPPATVLDLLSYKGVIYVSNLTGDVKARITTSGNITFTGLRSRRVEAHGSSGNVSFSGEILDGGEYTLKSFSGRVDATFPADADFKLSASSFSGVVDLGGFAMKFDRQTNQLVEATSGTGRASVNLWSQEGSIYLHRKP